MCWLYDGEKTDQTYCSERSELMPRLFYAFSIIVSSAARYLQRGKPSLFKSFIFFLQFSFGEVSLGFPKWKSLSVLNSGDARYWFIEDWGPVSR